MVAAGIFLSRVLGLVRQRAFAHYLGNSDAADAFTAAFRIPNVLQNLFGEGALSASFIPVYAGLLGRDEQVHADRTAGAIGALLGVAVAAMVAVGVLAAPVLVTLIAPGFDGAKRDLTIQLVRILFPGAGLLVMSAWCLGVLNSHRRFFLSYAAPVAWNLAIIGTLLALGGRLGQFPLAVAAAWASVAGSLLQVLVQWPTVRRVAPALRLRFQDRTAHVRTVLRNFTPALVSRGVLQVSAFVDELIATLLPTGAVAAIGYAQSIYTLPVSLFGMSVSAAELPAMAQARGSVDEIAAHLRARLASGLRKIAFFVVPSAMVARARSRVAGASPDRAPPGGHASCVGFAGSAVGLPCPRRLYASAFTPRRTPGTPLRFAIVRGRHRCARPARGARLPTCYWSIMVGRPASRTAGLAGWLSHPLAKLAARIGAISAPREFWPFWISPRGGGRRLGVAGRHLAADPRRRPRARCLRHRIFLPGLPMGRASQELSKPRIRARSRD
jgi:putative peptidoglycan lipid II flippase